MGLCQMGVFCGVELSDHGRGVMELPGAMAASASPTPTLDILPRCTPTSFQTHPPSVRPWSFSSGLTRDHNGVCLEIRCRAFDAGPRDCRNGAAASIKVRKLRPTRI